MYLLPLLTTLIAGDPSVISGGDLVAWRAIQREATSEQLMEFVETYPTSPLAELAWRRLGGVDESAPESVVLSMEGHERNLSRGGEKIAIAPLNPSLSSEPTTPASTAVTALD